MINPKRGEIYYVYPQGVLDNDDNEVGTSRTDVKNGRPAIILGNDQGNKNSNMCVIAWLTRQDKAPLPEHVTVTNGPATGSTMLIEHPITVSQSRLGNFISVASDRLMVDVNAAILVGMGVCDTLEQAGIMLGNVFQKPNSTNQPLNETSSAVINCIQTQLEDIRDERDFLRHIVSSVAESGNYSK